MSCCRTQPWSAATTRAAFLRAASTAARPALPRASSSGSVHPRSARHRPRVVTRCRRASASCCKAPVAAATAIRVNAIAPPLPAISPRDTCRAARITKARPMTFSSWRGVVGMINPTMRPGVTEEVIRLLPEGIGLIPLFLNVRRGTEDEFAAMMPAYEELVAVLAECGCDLIHPHGAPPFMVQGRKREAEIVRRWERKYRTPIMTVAQNHVNALTALHVKTMVGATYFPPKQGHPLCCRKTR